MHQDYTYNTELLKDYWEIKMRQFFSNVTWSIIRESPPDNVSKRKCHLCLSEKLEISSY